MGKASRGKWDHRFERAHPKPFKHMDVREASASCGRPYDKRRIVNADCKVCEMTVLLHCSDCEIQITGCLCTAVARMTDAELAQFKQEIQMKRAREAGLVLPGDN